jgi:CheY-like chemotaxis protein
VQLFPPFPEREGQNELDRLDGEGRAVNREMPAPAGGREAFADARAVRPDVPALFASGYNENALHTNFVLDAGLRLIRKPFTRPELLGRVREALDEARKNGPGAGGGA